MCGEHHENDFTNDKITGSSPHVRGAPSPPPTHTLSAGIIPACAGSTEAATPPLRAPRDHPRMCGEHKTLTDVDQKLLGSSPHVRGALTCR